VMFGYLVFGDVPAPSTALGAVVIVGAGLYIFLREREIGIAPPAVNPPA